MGHKATSPLEFAESLVSYAPVANVLVMSGGIKGAKKLKEKRQIKNISFYHDFEFEPKGVRVRKASGKKDLFSLLTVMFVKVKFQK